MTITLKTSNGMLLECVKRYHDAPTVDVPGVPCEACKRPLSVRGLRCKETKPDTFEAEAVCADCQASAGTLIVTMGSIFGAEEDARVLGGPWKVY